MTVKIVIDGTNHNIPCQDIEKLLLSLSTKNNFSGQISSNKNNSRRSLMFGDITLETLINLIDDYKNCIQEGELEIQTNVKIAESL